ncbi:type-F conjugative transfer system protein TrbI [Yersinia massiliensis]|uniref:type-F conjugative transfer system protein TrbI n=1 Tax=Yersinia massiliensis TaxID=419257 RepID=UPI0002ECD548|nr:type-F conjugative transfer system protein TrbI [Yersinia massiliensis]QKJ09336.1 type-F conjugative transfer system protein TrbI [Yersinia massiliensis]
MNAETTPDEILPDRKVKRSKRRNRCLRQVAIVAFCMLCLNTGVTLLVNQWLTPKTVTFDMKGTIDNFMTQMTAKALSEETTHVLTRRFNEALVGSLDEYQRNHRAIVLVSSAVVSGAEDVTEDIQAVIATRMAGGQ